MTSHRFGGRWTADKLEILRKYIHFYTLALANKPNAQRPFNLVYIDAFAGTGRCRIRDGSAGGTTIDGSAKIALDNAPAFARLHFIETKRRHAAELAALIQQHPNGARATLLRSDARSALPHTLAQHDWRHSRGVLFLDPYGLQCTWGMLEQIAATRALDVFFLVSLSGLYRQAAVQEAGIDEGKAARLTAFLGTDAWRTTLYTREQLDLFGDAQRSRDPGWRDILRFTTDRLRSLMAYVDEPVVLGQANGAPLFALYFAVANPDAKAVDLARRVSRDILSRLR